jgi:hypothetical protein
MVPAPYGYRDSSAAADQLLQSLLERSAGSQLSYGGLGLADVAARPSGLSSLFEVTDVAWKGCAVGYAGDVCRDCASPGYYRLGDVCAPCPKAPSIVIAFFVIAIGESVSRKHVM